MKKLFLIPLMALMCTVAAWGVDVSTSDELIAAFAGSSATIRLTDDIELASGITIGTKNGTEAKKSFTLDINGHELTTKSGIKQTFILNRGDLSVINSVPGVGGIYNLNDQIKAGIPQYNSSYIIFDVYGSTTNDCDPETAEISALHSYLCIEEGVNLYSAVNALVITETGKVDGKSVSFGVRMDFKGAINPGVDQGKYGIKPNGTLSYIEAYKTRSPYIHVFPTATINVTHNLKKAVALYCSGYARWLVEGASTGATAVYVKAGTVALENAVAESTWTDTATLSIGGGNSGVNGGGNAIVLESKDGYAGQVNFSVSGDSKVSTTANGGAALTETVSSSTTKVETIKIDGGNFTSGEDGNAIQISNASATTESTSIEVYGVTLIGDIGVGEETGTTALEDLMPEGTHTTVVENEDGSKTTIISEGSAPKEYADFNMAVDSAAAHPDWNIKWTGIATVNIGDAEGTSVNKTLPELQMVSGSAGNLQQIIVHKNSELHIRHLIMNAYARIIVEPEGKLVVEGEQGMNAPSENNILIKADSLHSAYFLFNPAVTSNRHPEAKVEFTSKGYQYATGKVRWQRLGVPSWQPMEQSNMERDEPNGFILLKVENENPARYNAWTGMTASDLLKPFTSYGITSLSTTPGQKYTFDAEVVGNLDATLNLYHQYNHFANSYTAPMDIYALLNSFASHLSATIYLHDPVTDWWQEINMGSIEDSLDYSKPLPVIDPLRAFMFERRSAGANPVVNYQNVIWNPIMTASYRSDVEEELYGSPAPARSGQQAQTGKACIEIAAADGTLDQVRLIEDSRFSAEFDNGYDATKFMQDRPTFIFANNGDEKLGILATDNLEGTTFGLSTTDRTSFIMTFRNVRGMNYAIRDLLTGTDTEIVEGATYMFSVPENSTVENRFKIVAVNKVPTAIENTEVENTEKGIYNMAGQYVGTDFHILPAGVYVVDGKKIVK